MFVMQEQQRIRQPEKKINCDYRGDTQSILVALQVQGVSNAN